MTVRPVPRRHWRSYGTEALPTPAEALAEPFSAFPSWFLRVECDRCGKPTMMNEAHCNQRQRALPVRDFLAKMRHDGCGGRAGKVELIRHRRRQPPARAEDRGARRLLPHGAGNGRSSHLVDEHGAAARCRRRPLGLIQPGTALAQKLDALGCEHEGPLSIALCRLHVTVGDKPLQVAFLIAGKRGQAKLPDVTKQRDLGVR